MRKGSCILTMPQKPRSLDLNENAFRVMREATARHDPDAVKPPAKKKAAKKKNPAAVALGRLGGLKGATPAPRN
jgi:hypothetical protein